MKLLTCALLVVFPLTFNIQAHAKFGTYDEVIQAAQKDEEPNYQQQVMGRVFRHLNRFSRETSISSSREKLILLRSFGALFSLAHNDATDVAKNAAAIVVSALAVNPSLAIKSVKDASTQAALGFAKTTLQKMISSACQNNCKPPRKEIPREHPGRSEAARENTKDVATKMAMTATWTSLGSGATLDEAARVAYRVAEWVILNHLAEQILWQLPEFYADESLWIQDSLRNGHPLSDTQGFNKFVRRFCPQADAYYMLFLSPLFAQIDTHSDIAAVFQFSAGKQQKDSVVSWLPKEIIRHILSLR